MSKLSPQTIRALVATIATYDATGITLAYLAYALGFRHHSAIEFAVAQLILERRVRAVDGRLYVVEEGN